MIETTELEKIKKEASKFYNYEQAVKLMLNSIYGAFGNPYFYFFNVDIAETITLQGKDAILYTEHLLNRYFKDYWHKDIAAHKEMGITVTGKIEKPLMKLSKGPRGGKVMKRILYLSYIKLD